MDEQIKLIVIDDQELYLNSIKDYIDICNYSGKIDVIYERSAQKGLEKIKDDSSSLVILDAHIKDMNSMDFLHLAKGRDVKIILVSDKPSSSIKISALDNGAIAYFPKMYEPEDLDNLFELIVKLGDKGQLPIN